MRASELAPGGDAVACALDALSRAIIPADHRDEGAAAVDAGRCLADRMRAGRHAVLYADGLHTADAAARELFARPLVELSGRQVAAVLERLVTAAPRFFRQLRADVAALYLSDPAVCARIGFPGPSLSSGGYADFDRPQAKSDGQKGRDVP